MIKTLRITSVLAAIAAGVLIYYFVIPMVVGAGGDERVDKIIKSPTVAENFKKSEAPKKSSKGVSPLVQQASAFAGYLTPLKPKPSRSFAQGTKSTPRPLGPTSPKFKVFATTYFEGNPQLSQALIDEPGKGRYWVRQSSMVGHLLIEQVKDGVVVVKSSNDTYELAVESNSQTAPTKSTSPVSKGISGRSSAKNYSRNYRRPVSGVTSLPSKSNRTVPQATSSQLDSREKAKEDLIKRLEVLRKSGSATDKSRITELISTFSSKLTASETDDDPEKSGEKGTSTAKDPNKASSKIRGGKIDTGSVKPDIETKK